MKKAFVIGGLLGVLGMILLRRQNMDQFDEIYCATCAAPFKFADGGTLQFWLPAVGWNKIRVCMDCFYAEQENGPREERKRPVNDDKVNKLLEWLQ